MPLKLVPEHQTDTYKAVRGLAAAGDHLPEHQTPHTDLLICLAGALRFKMEGEETLLSAGETLVIPAKIRHSLAFDETCSFLLVLPTIATVPTAHES